MRKIKVLHIEHKESYSTALEDNLAQDTEIEIEVYHAEEPDKIEPYLESNRFDLVLTDVYWPHPKTAQETIQKLDEIINIIRARDSLVPIIVLSDKPQSFRKAMEYKGEIYDIWSKVSGYPEFHIYRVRNVVKAKQNILSENILVNYISDMFANEDNVWGINQITDFSNKYLESKNTGYILYRITRLFKDMAYKCGLEASFINDIFAEFASYEAMDLARSPTTWGHLRHSLSVYLMGYILLNSDEVGWDKEAIQKNLGIEDWDAVNKAWFIASSLHDSTIFLSHVPNILQIINKFVKGRLNQSILAKTNDALKGKPIVVDLTSIEDSKLDYRQEDKEIICQILIKLDKEELCDKILEYMETTSDHGILSAINLYSYSKTQTDLDKSVINNACYAMMIHNCIDKIGVPLVQDGDFIAQLLCFVDRFQAWGRENQYEGLLGGRVFEQIVLREFDLTSISNEESKILFSMKIDHLPLRYISPSDPYLREKEEELIDILRNNFDMLKLIDVREVDGKKEWKNIVIEFSFCILGRELDV